MKYHSATIGELLSRLNQDIFIPGIQRPYVWEPEQIIKLFDSLMRGYPINSFLFWELQPQNYGDWDIYRFVTRFRQGDIHNEPAQAPTDRPVVLVLDGQQRLTSMLIGLMGSYSMRVKSARRANKASWFEDALYLDLLQVPADAEKIDAEAAAGIEAYYGFKFFDAEKPPKPSAEHIWFRVSQIMRISTPDQLDAAIEQEIQVHEGMGPNARRAIRQNLSRLHNVVWREDCIAYYMERDQSYDKVLDIFIRANDGGVKLSKSDMLMSMVTLRWEKTHAREVTEQLTYHLRATLQQENKFDRDFLLRAGLFFNDLDFAFNIGNFTPRNIATIEATWTAVSEALRRAAELLRQVRITGSHLTGHNALMLVACYLYKLNIGMPIERWEILPADAERVRRWLVSVLFHNVLSGTANVTMELFRNVLNDHLKSEAGFPAQTLVDRMTLRGRVMKFDDAAVERFVRLEGKGRLGEPCLSLLYDRTDWAAEPWVLVSVVHSHRVIEERLLSVGVPEAEVRTFGSWVGRIANCVLLTQAEAREHHQMDFEDWVTTRGDAWLERHLLPIDLSLYHERCFLDFIKARTALIARRLTMLFDEPAVASETVAAA